MLQFLLWIFVLLNEGLSLLVDNGDREFLFIELEKSVHGWVRRVADQIRILHEELENVQKKTYFKNLFDHSNLLGGNKSESNFVNCWILHTGKFFIILTY